MGREGHLRTFPRPSQRGPVLVPLSPVVLKIPEASAQPAVWWVRLVVLAPLAARRWVLASWIPVHWVPWSQTLLFPSSLSWTLHFHPGPGCRVQRCFLKAPRGCHPCDCYPPWVFAVVQTLGLAGSLLLLLLSTTPHQFAEVIGLSGRQGCLTSEQVITPPLWSHLLSVSLRFPRKSLYSQWCTSQILIIVPYYSYTYFSLKNTVATSLVFITNEPFHSR